VDNKKPLTLKRIIEENDSKAGKVFDLSIQSLILLSLIAFSFETLPNLSPLEQHYLQLFEKASVALFTIEYIFRFIVADHKLGFVFSFFGIIDLLAVLPFYIALGVDLRSIRALRFLRLFRILKMARYSRAIRRFHRAFIIAREELVLFFMVSMMAFYFAGVGIYYFEHEVQPEAFSSVPHSLWWALTTLTTVGYGDMTPITVEGKLFTFLMLMIGLGIVAIPSGIMATALAEARKMANQGGSEAAQPKSEADKT